MPDANALILEIFRQENQLAMSVFEQKELASTLRHYSQVSVSFSEIHKFCAEIISILNKADKSGALPADALGSLKKAGQLLWDHLLTRQAKEKLKASPVSDLVLSLDEELIHIPWELLYTGEDFLSLKFNLGRVIRTKTQTNLYQYRGSTRTPRMLILANPTTDLKAAYREGLEIKNQFDKKRGQISIDFKSTDIDTLYVKKNLRDYDIVHFAGHCEYDLGEPKNSGWVLSDGRFSARDIYALGETLSLPALVFSNACHSAEFSGYPLDKDYQERAFSLASAFLFSGVRHYIGTIRKIEDPISLSFAREFYRHLVCGKSVGASLRLGRLRLIKEHGPGAIAWASYLLYGDPNFVLFRTAPKPRIPKLKINIRRYKKQAAWLSFSAAVIALCIYLYMWLPTLNPGAYTLYLKSKRLFREGNNTEVVLFCQRIIEKNPRYLAAYPLLADAYQRLGKKDEALKYYFAYAMACEKGKDKKNLASAYSGLGWIYYLNGQFQKAFDFYNQALALSRENNDKLNEAMVLSRLALLYRDKKDYVSSLELLTKSSEINLERQRIYQHRYNLACDYFNIGLLFVDKDDFPTAKKFYEKSLLLFERLRLKSELSDCYFNLGEIYMFEKQYQKTLDYYTMGLKIDETQKNKFNLASDYNMIGELYIAMDNLSDAEKFFLQSVSLSKEINAQPELADAYYNLGLLAKQRNQKNKAAEFLRQARQINPTKYEEEK